MPMSDNFFVNYPTCCNESNTRLKVRTLVQSMCLDLNADRLELEDWAPLLKALRSDRKLHTLVIKSEYSSKYRRNCERKKPIFHKLPLINELVESVATCMKHSDVLSTVQLQSLPLNINHIKILADGIKNCTSLKNISLTGCIVNNGMDVLYESMYSHVGLKSIDLTGCGLTGQGAQMVAKLIETQRMARYDNMWRQSLRYREPGPEHFPGIRSITLNDNPNIGDFGFMAILNELKDDLWIQEIKLENCGLTSMSGTRSIELLKMNDTISVLNLDRNGKIVPAMQERIKCLLKEKERKQPKIVDVKQNNGKKQTGLVKKSNSQLSLVSERRQSVTSCLDTQNSLINNVELQHTKRKLDDTKRNLMKEKEKYEELKNEKQLLGEKFMKDWNKRKQIEKERDRLRKELMRLQSLGSISKPKLVKSTAMVNVSKKQNVDSIHTSQKKQNVDSFYRKQKQQNIDAIYGKQKQNIDAIYGKQKQYNVDAIYGKSSKKNSKVVKTLKDRTGKAARLHKNNHQNSNSYEVSDAEEMDIVPTEDTRFDNSSTFKIGLSPQLGTGSVSDDDTNYVNSNIDDQSENDPTDQSPIPRSMSILNGLLNNISKSKKKQKD